MAFPSDYSTLDTDIVDSTATDNADLGKDHATVHNELHGAVNDIAAVLTTSGDLLTYNDTNWTRITRASLAGDSAFTDAFVQSTWRKVVRKTADESVTSSTTLQNDDALLFAIAANEVWVVDFQIIYTGDTTGDIQVAVDGPTGCTVLAACFGMDGPATTSSGSLKINTGTDGASMGGRAALGSGSQLALIVRALIANSSTAGNVTLQWAQDASSGTALTVKANSYLVAHRIA